MITFAIGVALGFVGAYGLDTFLVWKDNRKWR
jgi:nitrate reductase NapE component